MDRIKYLLEKLKIFDTLYDTVRIVDPVKKKLMILSGDEIKETDHICFAFWDKEALCDNCISIRALNENKSFIKIEKQGNNLFMATAVPVRVKESTVIVELLKNVTGSMLFSEEFTAGNPEIYDVINSLNELVSKDGLTGLFNRRYVNERLPVEMLKLLEPDNSMSVIMADIDFFKTVNDTYGHFAGDEVLKEFSEVLKESVRLDNDWVARFGGEEFLICLPGVNMETALKTAERIRKKVEDMNIIYKDKIIKITASFGVSTIDNNIINEDKSYKYEMLVEKADDNLYTAKRTGRNKVV